MGYVITIVVLMYTAIEFHEINCAKEEAMAIASNE